MRYAAGIVLVGLVLLWAGAESALADSLVEWNASEGVLPSADTPAWDLIDTSPGSDPTLASSYMVLSTSADAHNMAYGMSAGDLSLPNLLVVEASVQVIAGGGYHPARGTAGIFITTDSLGNGVVLQMQDDGIFVLDSLSGVGQTHAVDTTDDFHLYRFEVDLVGGLFDLYLDGSLVIDGSLVNHVPSNGTIPRIVFGEGSGAAYGTSHWEFVRHNAGPVPVPEPTTLGLVGVGCACVILLRRRRAA